MLIIVQSSTAAVSSPQNCERLLIVDTNRLLNLLNGSDVATKNFTVWQGLGLSNPGNPSGPIEIGLDQLEAVFHALDAAVSASNTSSSMISVFFNASPLAWSKRWMNSSGNANSMVSSARIVSNPSTVAVSESSPSSK